MDFRRLSPVAAAILICAGCAGSDTNTSTIDSTAPATSGADPASTGVSPDSLTETTSSDSSTTITTDARGPSAPTTDTDPGSSGPATSPDTADVSSSTTTEPTTTEPTETSTTTSSTSTTVADDRTPPAPTTTAPTDDGWDPAPTDLVSISVDVPTGEFLRAPGDLIAVRSDGDLEYRPTALGAGNAADPITLLERPDPDARPAEGPPPDTVFDVAAFVDGSVLYGDCCEPVSGNIFAVDGPGSDVGPIAVGAIVQPSPDGTQLAIAGPMQLGVVDADSGDGQALILGQDPIDGIRTILDLQWIDDDTFATVTRVDAQFGIATRLSVYDAATLARASGESDPAVTADIDSARFAGRTPNGLVAVEVHVGQRALVNYFELDTGFPLLELRPDRTQTFPPTVSEIEVDPNGLGQIWIDGETLYFLGPGSFDARPLAGGIDAAWFVTN